MANPLRKKHARLLSLDFFRGFCILAMIIVNSSGSGAYAFLKHAAWHGWTFADTIFPFFLWIIGVSMVFSFAKRMDKGESKGELFLHILQRSAILFMLGLFINLFPYFDFYSVRIMGVLQRIAIAYFFAGIILLHARQRGIAIWTVFLLAAYWAALMLVPVPGYGPGVLEKEGNLAQYVDSVLLKGHILEQTPAWDPEGILSTVPAVSTILFGVLIGQLLVSEKSKPRKFRIMLSLGFLLVIAGSIMSIWMPINKNLWTSSFSVFMSGLALIAFSISYWIIDMRGAKRWSLPFIMVGMNAIVLYVISGIMNKIVDAGINKLFYMYALQFMTAQNASLILSLMQAAVIITIAFAMYRKKFFVKV